MNKLRERGSGMDMLEIVLTGRLYSREVGGVEEKEGKVSALINLAAEERDGYHSLTNLQMNLRPSVVK